MDSVLAAPASPLLIPPAPKVHARPLGGSALARFRIAMAGERPVLPKASITLGPDHEPDFLLSPIVQARP